MDYFRIYHADKVEFLIKCEMYSKLQQVHSHMKEDIENSAHSGSLSLLVLCSTLMGALKEAVSATSAVSVIPQIFYIFMGENLATKVTCEVNSVIHYFITKSLEYLPFELTR